MSVPTNLIPTKITGLPEYTGTSQAGYFPYVLDGTTYKVQFSSVASAGEVPPSRTLTAGTGLVGGGDLSANRVFAIANGGVGAQQLDTTGVVAGVYGNASNIPTVTVDANGRVTSVTTSPVVATGYVPESRTITAGTGLIGGGSLANNITLSLNLSSATPQALGNATAGVSTAAARGDHVHPAVNLSDTNETQGALPLGRGGTGDALSPVAGAVVYSTGTKLAMTNPGIPGQVLTSNGTDEPLWTTIVGTGTVTSVNASGGTTGMTFTGGPVTTIGTLTLGGTLGTANGGTGVTGTPTNGQLLIGNGAGYTLAALTAGTGVSVGNAAGAITITNTAPDQIVSLTAGTAISVTGTYPNFTVTNTAPDQIVSLTGAGTTSISGTYPNFTITSNDQFVGTVTSVAASGGTTGLTFSGSPITSAGTLTLGGTLAIGSGGTGASTAGAARAALGAAASGANTDITSIALTSGTILNAPTSGTDIVNKAYADSIAAGINFHQSVRLATVAPLPANTYNNGSSGVGATLTANANGALSIDGVAVVAGNRVLVKNEVGGAQAYNGIYTVTQTGNGSTPFILTRATDFDSAGSGVDQIDAGDFFLVTAGNTLANTSWVQQTPLPITVGTTAIVFSQFGAPVLYSAGTGLTLAGTVFSITNTGVTANTYGSASQVPVIAVNAQGQITSASSTSIAISASQITSGVLPVGNGGTGATTFTSNGVLLGSGTSAVTTTAAGATGQVLVGNTGLAPTWATLSSTAVTSFSAGTTGLTPSSPTTGAVTLDGVLKVSNGGTGVTTATGTGSAVLSNSPTLVTPTLGAASATSIANGLGTVGSPSYVFTGDLNTGMWSPGTDTVAFSTNGSERMRIAADGTMTLSVGGVSNTHTFNYNESGGEIQLIDSTGAGSILIDNISGLARFYKVGTGGMAVGTTGTGAFQFLTNNAERMRIDSSGNVGIGTSSPSALLNVYSATGAFIDLFGDAGTTISAVRSSTDATGANLVLRKARGTTASRTAVASGDTMGTLFFSAFGGTSNRNIASIVGAVGTYTSDADISSNLLFNTTPTGSVSPAERMRIDSSGNVGIGTSAPGTRLDVIGNATFGRGGGTFQGISLTNGDNSASAETVSFIDARNNLGTADGDMFFGHQTDGGSYIRWATTAPGDRAVDRRAERMRIQPNGNVGIGTTSPGATLTVVTNTTSHNGMRVTNNSTTQFAGSGLQMLGPSAAGSQGGAGIYYYNTNVGGTTGALGIAQLDNNGNFQRNLAYYDYNSQFWGFATNSAERLRIDSSGNVGIGTSAPSQKLQVAASTNQLSLTTGTNELIARASSTEAALYTFQAIPLVFYNNNAERMRIDSSGNLLVGTTAVDANIGGASGTGMQFSVRVGFGLRSSINTDVHYWNKYPTGDLHQFRCAGTVVGSISITGSTTAYNITSDRRLKHDIVDAPEASSLIDAIKVRSFKWNADNSEQRYGMIAQELLEVAPEAVSVPADEDQMMGVDYSKLVPMLVKEIQSLRARVAQLEGK